MGSGGILITTLRRGSDFGDPAGPLGAGQDSTYSAIMCITAIASEPGTRKPRSGRAIFHLSGKQTAGAASAH
jgi:hypothetical protein